MLGKLLGAAAGYLLAPATGGASLALASAGLGASIGGALDASQAAEQQAGAAQQAAATQAAASNRAAEIQREMFNQQLVLQREQFDRQVALQEPWRRAGEQALNRLVPMATQYTPFGMQQFQADPGYAFRLSEGQKALERSAAARGGLISGNALRAAQQYGQQMGSQEYQNAFNRYQAEREAQLNPLQSLAGVGQTTAARLGEAGQQYATRAGEAGQTYGTNVGNLGLGSASTQANALLAGAQARASAYKGMGESFGGFLGSPLAGQLANYYMTPSNANAYIPMQPGGGY